MFVDSVLLSLSLSPFLSLSLMVSLLVFKFADRKRERGEGRVGVEGVVMQVPVFLCICLALAHTVLFSKPKWLLQNLKACFAWYMSPKKEISSSNIHAMHVQMALIHPPFPSLPPPSFSPFLPSPLSPPLSLPPSLPPLSPPFSLLSSMFSWLQIPFNSHFPIRVGLKEPNTIKNVFLDTTMTKRWNLTITMATVTPATPPHIWIPITPNMNSANLLNFTPEKQWNLY